MTSPTTLSPEPTVSAAAALADIHAQVIWNRLVAVVEEQARTLMKTAFSAVVRESGDLSAGVFNTRGQMIAQAITGTPGHVNTMAEAVPHFLKQFPTTTMAPGDHFVTNDPWLASGHLHDLTVVSPAFRDGQVIALFACTCHQLDIGGRGQGPDGKSVYEEGLFIPIMQLARGGMMNDVLLEIIRHNVRTPYEVEGDIHSYVASNETGMRKLSAMMDEFELATLEPIAEYILNRSQQGMIAEINKLPFGEYHNSLTIDGYHEPVRLACRLLIERDQIKIDYEGSSPASLNGINLVLNYCKAYSAFGVRCVIAPLIPNNAGSLSPIEVSAPPGSVLNVNRPWPVCARHIIGQFLPDVVMGALAKAIPEKVPAEGASCVWGAQLRGGANIDVAERWDAGESTDPYEIIFFNSGGSGARATLDGLSATAFPSGVRAMPTEVVENLAPIVVWKKELRPDSAGAGTQRGGFGQTVITSAVNGAPFNISAMFDRVKHSARGRNGGRNGASGKIAIAGGAELVAMGRQLIPAGERLQLDLPGGAGYGDPLLRQPKAVADDVANGLLSRKNATRQYGVVIDKTGRPDNQATKTQRKKLRNK